MIDYMMQHQIDTLDSLQQVILSMVQNTQQSLNQVVKMAQTNDTTHKQQIVGEIKRIKANFTGHKNTLVDLYNCHRSYMNSQMTSADHEASLLDSVRKYMEEANVY